MNRFGKWKCYRKMAPCNLENFEVKLGINVINQARLLHFSILGTVETEITLLFNSKMIMAPFTKWVCRPFRIIITGKPILKLKWCGDTPVGFYLYVITVKVLQYSCVICQYLLRLNLTDLIQNQLNSSTRAEINSSPWKQLQVILILIIYKLIFRPYK